MYIQLNKRLSIKQGHRKPLFSKQVGGGNQTTFASQIERCIFCGFSVAHRNLRIALFSLGNWHVKPNPHCYWGRGRNDVPAKSSIRAWVCLVVIITMTPIEDFKLILKEQGIELPEESLIVFRDLVDMQADLILDGWYEDNRKQANQV